MDGGEAQYVAQHQPDATAPARMPNQDDHGDTQPEQDEQPEIFNRIGHVVEAIWCPDRWEVSNGAKSWQMRSKSAATIAQSLARARRAAVRTISDNASR